MKNQDTKIRYRHFIPIIILLVALGLFFYFRLYRYVSFSALQHEQAMLQGWTKNHFFLTSVIFFVLYAIAVAVSIPGAAIFTIAGGFLFGPVVGSIYVVISATIGATVIFWAAKTALHDLLYRYSHGRMKVFREGFNRNAASYMLFLRLVPIFPFWIINIIPAFLRVRTSTFIWTTFVGIIPGSIVYVSVGHGIGHILKRGEQINMSIIFEPRILLPILGLAILALVPIAYKKIRGKRTA